MKRASSLQSSNIKQQCTFSTSNSDIQIASVQKALQFLTTGETKGKAAASNLSVSLKVVEHFSQARGLLGDDLIKLIRIIGQKRFSDRINRRLISCLIPYNIVPEEAVTYVICWICMNTLNLTTKAELLKWILAVFDLLESKDNLLNLYEVILHFIEYDLLRPYVCHLLFKLTRPEDVQAYRIRHLIDLQCRVGPQPYLLALLNRYGLHKPELLVVQNNYKHCFRPLGQLNECAKNVQKRIQPPTLPVERTFLRSSKQPDSLKRIPEMKNVKTISDITEILKLAEVPNSITNLLEPSVRHFLFTSCASSLMNLRFSFWLRNVLLCESSEKVWCVYKGKPLLKVLAEITEELKEGIPEVEHFLQCYLEMWDGHTHFSDILKLLQYWRLCPFHVLKEVVLQPLYKYFCISSVKVQCAILHCLTNLYENWVLWEIPRWTSLNGYMQQEENGCGQSSINIPSIFDRKLEDFDPYQELMELAKYIDKLCVISLIINSDYPPSLLHFILTFYHTALTVQKNNSVFLPSPSVIYGALFSFSAAPLSEVCRLVNRYKEIKEAAKANSHHIEIDIKTLNRYIVDMCNVLWRCKAFLPCKSSHVFRKALPSNVTDYIQDVELKFTVFNHPALRALQRSFKEKYTTDIQLTVGPSPNEKSIYHSYFKHLSLSGMWEVVKFVHIFIRNL